MGGLFFAILTTLYTLFGVFLYELRVFTYIDEAFAMFIAGYGIFQMAIGKVPKNKPFIIWLCIAAFYLGYSVLIKSNVHIAIANDFIMQTKPYMVFFGLMTIKPKLKREHWLLLQIFSWACIIMMAIIIYYYPHNKAGTFVGELLTGEAFSATAILVAAMYYLSCESDSMLVRLFTFLMMCIGLLAPTSKFLGTLFCTLLILYTVNKPLKINIRNLLIAVAGLVAVAWLVWDDFVFYFVEDFEGGARPLLYVTMPKILNDYIPFGSGFATFANAASATWYSPLYEKYELDMIWGLAQGETLFVSDTYYPTLAQFGYVGIGLFIWLFVYIFGLMKRLFTETHDIKRYRVALIMIAYILIQATTGSFINERCVLAMILLALSLYKPQTKRKISELDSFGLKFIQYTHNKRKDLQNQPIKQ